MDWSVESKTWSYQVPNAVALPWFFTVHDTVICSPLVIVGVEGLNAFGARSGTCTVMGIGAAHSLFVSLPSLKRPAYRSMLFPYTTLFRSVFAGIVTAWPFML